MNEQKKSYLYFYGNYSKILQNYKGSPIKIYIKLIFLALFFSSCAVKQPILSQSATILLKSPNMKFYDKGFIKRFPNYTQVAIFSTGVAVLELFIYEDKICKSTFACEDLASFNKKYLHTSYKDSFLKELFDKTDKNITYEDKENKILIKILKD